MVRLLSAKVIDVIMPDAHCWHTFSDQSIIEMRIEAWDLSGFSPAPCFDDEIGVYVLRERNMHES